MTYSKIAILDVGHGNCAVLIDQNGVVVIDTGLGATLANFLRENRLHDVRCVFISHADKDHIAGLVGLLSLGNVRIGEVYLNPDAPRRGKIWDDLISVLKAARHSGTRVINGLSTSIPGKLNMGKVQVQVLAPAAELALRGVGGKTLDGKLISAHTLNAVIRLVHRGRSLALLLGDLDESGLEQIIGEGLDIAAEVVVFPHHGGSSGKNPARFARKICELARPDLVAFSIGRGKHNTPRPDIVSTVKKVLPAVHVACTQLSTRCAVELPKAAQVHLTEEVAQGRESNKCCAGTILINIGRTVERTPSAAAHSAFIEVSALTAICRTQ